MDNFMSFAWAAIRKLELVNLVNKVINGSGHAESDNNVTSKVYTHLPSLFDHQAW